MSFWTSFQSCVIHELLAVMFLWMSAYRGWIRLNSLESFLAISFSLLASVT
jgi:hypothetical protein